jgi:hypothetical protein
MPTIPYIGKYSISLQVITCATLSSINIKFLVKVVGRQTNQNAQKWSVYEQCSEDVWIAADEAARTHCVGGSEESQNRSERSDKNEFYLNR